MICRSLGLFSRGLLTHAQTPVSPPPAPCRSNPRPSASFSCSFQTFQRAPPQRTLERPCTTILPLALSRFVRPSTIVRFRTSKLAAITPLCRLGVLFCSPARLLGSRRSLGFHAYILACSAADEATIGRAELVLGRHCLCHLSISASSWLAYFPGETNSKAQLHRSPDTSIAPTQQHDSHRVVIRSNGCLSEGWLSIPFPRSSPSGSAGPQKPC